MRWARLPHGTTRTRSGFLWQPKSIGEETRWLERAAWREEYFVARVIGGSWWRATEWLDDGYERDTFTCEDR